MWIDLMCPLQISPLRLHHWNIVEWQVVALWPKLRRCWRMAFKRRGRIQHSLRPLPLTHLKEKSRHLEPQRNDIGITWHDWAWGAWNLELQRRQSHRNWSSHQSSWHSSCAQSYGKWKIIVFLPTPWMPAWKPCLGRGWKGEKTANLGVQAQNWCTVSLLRSPTSTGRNGSLVQYICIILTAGRWPPAPMDSRNCSHSNASDQNQTSRLRSARGSSRLMDGTWGYNML